MIFIIFQFLNHLRAHNQIALLYQKICWKLGPKNFTLFEPTGTALGFRSSQVGFEISAFHGSELGSIVVDGIISDITMRDAPRLRCLNFWSLAKRRVKPLTSWSIKEGPNKKQQNVGDGWYKTHLFPLNRPSSKVWSSRSRPHQSKWHQK